MDFRWMIYGLASLAVAYVVLTVLDLVVTGVGLTNANLNSSYQEFTDKAGLALKIGVFGLIIIVVYTFFLSKSGGIAG